MKKNDKKNFIWNAIGLSAYSFVSLFLLVIVKLINGIDIAGVFTYAFAITTLFFYFSLYYNRSYQIANYSKNNFDHFLSTRILTSVCSFLFMMLFSVVSGFGLYKIVVICMLMIFRTIDSISDCFYGYLQSKEKLYQVGISYSLKSIIGILMFSIVDYFTKNLILSLIVFIFVNILLLLFYDFKSFSITSSKKVTINFKRTKKILIESLPIFIFSFLAVYLANCQKYVITYISSNELQTIFSILIMPATVITLLGNYLIHPFINKFNTYYKNKKYKKFNHLLLKILSYLLLIGFLIILVSWLIGIELLNFVYQISLNKYRLYLIVVLTASILYTISMILSSLLTLMNINKSQVICYIISSLIATISCYLLAKEDVIMGAVLSYIIAAFINLLLFLIIYIRHVIFKRMECAK